MRLVLPYKKFIEYVYDSRVLEEEIRKIAVHFPIFLSSHIIGLEEIRDFVAKEFLKFGFKVLGWKEGEMFGTAQKETPREIYLNALNRSKVYCGILDNEYGSLIKGENISATEDEYNHAIKKELNLCLLVSKGKRKKTKTKLLIKKWKDRHTISQFADLIELKKEIHYYCRNFLLKHGENWIMVGDSVFASSYQIKKNIIHINKTFTNHELAKYLTELERDSEINFIDISEGKTRQVRIKEVNVNKKASLIWEIDLKLLLMPELERQSWSFWKNLKGLGLKNFLKLTSNESRLEEILMMMLNVNRGEMLMHLDDGSNLYSICQEYYHDPFMFNILAKTDIIETLTKIKSGFKGEMHIALPCLESVHDIQISGSSETGFDLKMKLKMKDKDDMLFVGIKIQWSEET